MKRLTATNGGFTVSMLVILSFCIADTKGKEACGAGGVCKCREGENKNYEVDCSNRKLEKIPQHIPPNATRLFLDCNHIKKPNGEALRNLPNLQFINASFNDIIEIRADTFGYLLNLVTLDLSNNKIHQLHDDTFRNLSSLQNLYLSQNKFKTFPTEAVSNQPSLQILLLQDNQLTHLPQYVLKPSNITYQLRVLGLHRNHIQYLSEDVFHGLPNLQVLSIFHNNIQTIADDCFSGMGNGTIYLFGNNLANLTNSSFNNEKIREIHLYGNTIIRLENTALTGVSEYTQVYIDCQQVEEIQQPNVELTCVTPQFVPNVSVPAVMTSVIENAGFECGNKTCSPCSRGTFGRKGKCISCPRGGFYQDEIGVASKSNTDLACRLCPNGTFVKDGEGKSSGDCIVCPDGTIKTSLAGYRACFCSDRYARMDRFGKCTVCLDEGINCGKDYKAVEPGYYWSWDFPGANMTLYKKFTENLQTKNDSYDFNYIKYHGAIPIAFKCPRSSSCNNTNNDVTKLCSEGYTGWLCSKCDQKFYSVLNYCLPCPKTEWLGIELALMCCFCVIMYAIGVRVYKMERFRNRRGRFFFDKIISRGKIALGFYQVVGEFFASVHDVNWAKDLKFIGDFISLIELNIFRMIIRPKCFDEKLQLNPKMEFVIGMTFPCLLICLSSILYWIITRISVSDTDRTKKIKSRLLTFVIVLLFITYPPVCTTVFQLYPRACETFCLDVKNTTCKTLLRSDYHIHCEGLKTYHVFAYISTAVYVVGFPVVLYLLMRKNTDHRLSHQPSGPLFETIDQTEDDQQNLVDDSLSTRTNPIWIDFLCENYKPQFWYWEIVELTRKVTQTVLITLLGWEKKLTVLLTIAISVLYLTLHARYMPMKSAFEQRLQMFALVAILGNVLVAAMEVPDEYGNELSIALIILNLLVIVIVVAEVLFGLFILLKHLAVHNRILHYVMSCRNRTLSLLRRRSGHNEESALIVDEDDSTSTNSR